MRAFHPATQPKGANTAAAPALPKRRRTDVEDGTGAGEQEARGAAARVMSSDAPPAPPAQPLPTGGRRTAAPRTDPRPDDAYASPAWPPPAPGAGAPLPAGERRFFERRFGFDFGAVRVVDDAQAAATAAHLHAAAYTVGSTVSFAAGRFAPATPAGRHLIAHELAHVVQQSLGPPPAAPALQRADVADAPPAPEPGQGALLVEDDETPTPVQLRKSELLSQLQEAACRTVGDTLRGTGWSAEQCPWIERWIEHYRGKDSAHVERALRRFAPETRGATTAAQYVTMVSARIDAGVRQWRETGEMPELPEGLQGELTGGGLTGLFGGLLASVGSAVSSVVGAIGGALSGIGRLFRKADGAAASRRPGQSPARPEEVRRRLGAGAPLDARAKGRMERATGQDFSSVRIHTDAAAARTSDELGARALTVGEDIAFAAGQYRPGHVTGDALLAHELAHVLQQRAGAGSRSAADDTTALEHDADRAAAGTVAAAWLGDRAPGLLGQPRPARSSGLALQRCHTQPRSTLPQLPAPEVVNEPGPARPMTPSQDPTIDDVIISVSPCGDSGWTVNFQLPTAAATAGWIIQEITWDLRILNPNGTDNRPAFHQHYWEAFQVNQGQQTATSTDNYVDRGHPNNTSGSSVTVGKAKFYEGTLPANQWFRYHPDLRSGPGGLGALALPATTQRPDFWDASGTDHNLTVTWDCTNGQDVKHLHAVAGSRIVDQ
ncbi:MAG TPA: DUF4157 domain-containing protein [Myxococcota bacterium]|jgi:hypothetical protein|nr:DUF4157 domain-containing protein [Myxococcota bacterium]